MVMDIDTRRFFDERYALFETDGWRTLLNEEVKTLIEANESLYDITDIKTLYMRKGALQVLNWLANLEELTRNTEVDEVGENV
jgi:hypothetical protein|tara:strand:+ start:210 stop:458 length:249 start_codon:yes stop_codon:yes gene_type:complete